MSPGRKARDRTGDSGSWASIERWATYAAVVAVAAFLGWALIRAGEITGLIYQNGDAAGALVLAEFFGERGSGSVVLGYYWLEPLYAMRLTAWLPAHREIWEAGPFIVYAATVALARLDRRPQRLPAGGAARRARDGAPAPVVLRVIGTPVSHQHTLAHGIVLAAFLITLPKLATWGAGKRALWGIALAVTLAPGASSDIPLIIGGVVPFLVAVGYAWVSGLVPRTSAAIAAVGCLAGAAGGLVLRIIAENDGIIADPGGEDFPPATPGRALDNVPLLAKVIALFVHGRFDGPLPLLDDGIVLATIIAVPLLGS